MTFVSRAKAVAQAIRQSISDANAAAAPNWPTPDRDADRRLLWVILVCALALLVQHYLVVDMGAGLPTLLWVLGFEQPARDLYQYFAAADGGSFRLLLWWAAGTVVCFLVAPAVCIVATGGRLSEFGLRAGHGRDRVVYLALLAFMLPLIVLGAALIPGLADYYPFYKPPAGEALWPRFAVFEGAYLVQFIAIEFFFRGVLIHAAKHRFGAWAIVLPLIPYVMLHFGKPPAEATGALIAGVVLGFLSLRTGSIVFGVLLHAGVALAMDLTALTIRGQLF